MGKRCNLFLFLFSHTKAEQCCYSSCCCSSSSSVMWPCLIILIKKCNRRSIQDSYFAEQICFGTIRHPVLRYFLNTLPNMTALHPQKAERRELGATAAIAQCMPSILWAPLAQVDLDAKRKWWLLRVVM